MKKKLFALLSTVVAAFTLSLACACGEAPKKIAYSEVAIASEQYAFGVSKTQTDLLASANEMIAEMKANGELNKLVSAERDGTAGNIGEVKTTSTDRSTELVVATNAEFAPYEYKQGAFFAGIDMQMAKLLAAKVGKTLVILDMDFDSVVVSVGNGSADIAMAGLSITEDRKESVTFTDYYLDSTLLVAYQEGDEAFEACKTVEDFEALFASLTGVSAGAPAGYTGYYYLTGAGDEYEGYSNITAKAYDTIPLALKDLQSGRIRFVIADATPLIAAAEQLNG